MKKIIVFSMCAIVALVSCQKSGDLNSSENGNKMMVMAAIDNGGQTKTTAQDEGDVTKVLWSDDDAFAMSVKGGDFAKFVLTSGAGSQVGTFEVEGIVTEGVSTGYVAYYPYQEGIIYADGQLNVNFPAVQSYVVGSIAAAPMVAVSETENLKFFNVASLLKITLKGEAVIRTITLTGNNDETLAGAAEVAVGLSPVLSLAGAADSKVITLDCGEGVALTDDGVDFYFALPAITFDGGFTIKATDVTGAYMIKSTDSEVILSASKVKVYPVFDYVPEWEEVSSEDELNAAIADGGLVKLAEDIVLTNYIDITTEVVLDLNGYTLSHPSTSPATYKDVIEVRTGGRLTINGEGEVIAEDGYSIYAAGDAVVNINGGYYFSWVTAIDARKDAQVTINNGVFEVDGSTNPDGDFGQVFTLNLRDKKNSYVTDKSNIIVKGGEFYNYNPSASMSENPIADFVAPGYRVVNKESGVDMTEPHDASGEDIWYKVVK